jgi:hypothetical protein
VDLDPSKEFELVSRIASSWYVEGILPTFAGLRSGLTARLSKIRELASKEALLTESGRSARLESQSFLHLHFLQAAAVGIELFDQLVDEEGSRWALLCDELELAPPWIQSELLTSLRSTDDRFLFKLALNPFTDNNNFLTEATSAAAGQDFEQLALWYAEKRDALRFCRNLWHEMLAAHDLKPIDAVKVFGKSQFDADPSDDRKQSRAYGPDSRWAKKFLSLAEKDRSFRRYVTDGRHIDLKNMHLLTENTQAAEVRKIAPIVAIRDFYRQKDDEASGTQLRSRKAPLLYSGAESIFAITEGNPRWFLGLMGAFIDFEGTSIRQFPGDMIPAPKQAEEILKVAQRFAATLKTIPTRDRGTDRIGVLQLVKRIARYFNDQAVVQDFRPEPPGSFTVDSSASEAMVAALGQALNAGAIVYVPDLEGQLILTSLRGKRFRLSYLLAPLYRFPIRLGASVSLGTIMRWQDKDGIADSRELPFAVGGHSDV